MAESWDGTCPFTAYFFQVFRLILDLIIRRYFSPLLLPSLWFNRNHLDPVVLSGFHQALMKSLLAQKRVSYGYVWREFLSAWNCSLDIPVDIRLFFSFVFVSISRSCPLFAFLDLIPLVAVKKSFSGIEWIMKNEKWKMKNEKW
jgi:hypothetical protein